MNRLNRVLVCAFCLAWCAALAGVLLLVWDQARAVDVDGDNLRVAFDLIASSQAEQILATILAGVLAVPALTMLALETVPRRPAERLMPVEERGALRARLDALEREVRDERSRRERSAAVSSEGDESTGKTAHRRWRFLPGAHG